MTQLKCSLCVLSLIVLGGCAAGKTATGGVVVGFDVARMPESAGEVANAAATFLPQPWRGLAETAIYVLGGGGVVGAVGYAAKKKGEEVGWIDRDQHQAKIDATYDLGRTEASK